MKKYFDKVLLDTSCRGTVCKFNRRTSKWWRRREKETLRRNPDQLPDRAGMWRSKCGCTPSWRSAPLLNFLDSRVGQRWDDVWSEICQTFSSRTFFGGYIRDDINGWMVTNSTHKSWRRYLKTKSFCVDGGLLRRIEDVGLYAISRRSYGKTSTPHKAVIFVDCGNALYRSDDVWYIVELANIEKNTTYYDAVTRTWFRYIEHVGTYRFGANVGPISRNSAIYFTQIADEYCGKPRYAKSKRQLNKKELKERGIRK